MKRVHRISRQDDFRRLLRRGRRFESPLFRVMVHANTYAYLRIAFVVGRTVDKRAAVRNSLRRRSREWVRTHIPLERSLDVMIVFKKAACVASRKELIAELERVFKRIVSVVR